MDTNALRARIADELNRTDLAAQIQREINSAIKHYESQRFPWNESRDKVLFVTTQGERYYSLTADVIKVDEMKLHYNNSWITIRKRTWEEIDQKDLQISTSEGASTEYVIYGSEVRLYPVPDASRTVLGACLLRPRLTSLTGSYCGSQTLTPTSTASHNNRLDGWTIDGENLIRTRAIAAVRINTLKQESAIVEMMSLSREGFLSHREKIAYKALSDEVSDRIMAGRVKPYL